MARHDKQAGARDPLRAIIERAVERASIVVSEIQRLPGAEDAYISDEKIGYYFRETGEGAKGPFFLAHGFVVDQPEQLREAILEHARIGEVFDIEPCEWGVKYRLWGTLRAPTGRDLFFTSVWIVRFDETFPRSVTVCPSAHKNRPSRKGTE
jgi:hypothetical protein